MFGALATISHLALRAVLVAQMALFRIFRLRWIIPTSLRFFVLFPGRGDVVDAFHGLGVNVGAVGSEFMLMVVFR